jgi:uncharacterized membrane protein YgcG
MRCPSCRVPFSSPPGKCPKCGLTLAELDRKFGIVPLYSRYLTDRTERLSLRDATKLREALQLFGRKFPQLLFSAVLIDLRPRAPIAEYAFWLINRACFSEFQATGPRNFELLLVLDPGAKEAALMTGYGLENVVAEEDLEAALNAGQAGFEAGDLAGAIHSCIEFMTRRLREIGQRSALDQTSTGPAAIKETAGQT